MEADGLLRIYAEDERLKAIRPALSDGGRKRVALKGLVGSGAAVIAQVLSREITANQLFIARDKEQAAYFCNDLQKLGGEPTEAAAGRQSAPETKEASAAAKKVLFYPASYKHPYQTENVDNANVLTRTETLNRLRSGEKGLKVVTYPEALSEKVIATAKLSSMAFAVHLGESLSQDFLSEFFDQYHFRQVDFVAEPGDYALRGGIIDVFSYSDELPFRIELDDEKVVSLRSFEVGTQLSVAHHRAINIVPDIQQCSSVSERVGFLSYFEPAAPVWLEDAQSAFQALDASLQKAIDAYNKLESIVPRAQPQALYSSSAELIKGMENRTVVEFGKNFYFTDGAVEEGSEMCPLRYSLGDHKGHLGRLPLAQLQELHSQQIRSDDTVPNPPTPTDGIPGQDIYTLHFNQQPQPVFNKKFELLAEYILDSADHGFKQIILSENPKQFQRLDRVFFELSKPDRPIRYIPLPISLNEGFVDNDLKIACFTDHQIFERYHRFTVQPRRQDSQALTLKELYSLKPGDYIMHIDHGIGRFAGLEKVNVNGREQEAICLLYKDNDMLRLSIHGLHKMTRYTGKEGAVPVLNRIGSNAWTVQRNKAKQKVKDIARELIQLYAKRKASKGFAFSADTYLQHELESSFFYEDTPDQLKASNEVKHDMEGSEPMDRLVCGDVGFGKTEVAVRAAFKAATDGKQVAVLVPTTVLAYQHFKTFSERLENFPVTVDYLNRFRSSKQIKDILKRTSEGKIDILIGTHRILSKDVKFKDLGLLVIDEEQKFGVAMKEKLKNFKINVDTLTLTATPIPRTLQFSLMGARDLSIIQTPPANRYPVHTEVRPFSEEIIRDAIVYELGRRGQVFFVNDRVENIMEVAGMVQRLVPDARIAVAHGQMEGEKLEEIMMGFMEGECDILVCTKIVENGLDVTNANTIIVNNAHHYGLNELHQLRGRVGRSNKKAFCYFLAPPEHLLTADAKRRLRAVEEFSEIGGGFQIAMRDLDIRGAGNILGGEQSGFISEIGIEMYQRILDEAIQEIRQEQWAKGLSFGAAAAEEGGSGAAAQTSATAEGTTEAKTFAAIDCQIETDLEILIPDYYVENITERLSLYKELDSLETDAQLDAFAAALADRFGPLPAPTQALVRTIALRRLAKRAGWNRVNLKQGRMTSVFAAQDQGAYYQSGLFEKILTYVQDHPDRCHLQELKNGRLAVVFDRIETVQQAEGLCREIFPDTSE